jgi:heme exporter protein C
MGVLAGILWAWIALVMYGAFFWAPLAEGFIGQSSRILFFHVPMAWVSFVAFMAAGFSSARLLMSGQHQRHDRSAAAAVEIGLVFCVLATITGAQWAKVMWGAYWNWDPRQTSIAVALLFYAAYLVLRDAIEDPERRARVCASYAILGLVVAPFFFFILPRLTFSLHPQTVVNTSGKIDMDSKMLTVLMASLAGFTALYFWMHRLRVRAQSLLDARLEAHEERGA